MLFKDKADTVIFLVQGSAIEPYEISFLKHGNNLNAYCTCPAGMNGQHCKHRFGILEGSSKGVISDNIDQVKVVAGWLPGTDVEEALFTLNEWEFNMAKLKREGSQAKKDVAKAMRE